MNFDAPPIKRLSPIYLPLGMSRTSIHAHSLGVADEGAHVDILRPAFRAAELGRAGADLLCKLGLRQAPLFPLIGKLEADAEDLDLFLECLADR